MLLGLVTLVASALFTGLARHYLLWRKVLDVPNARGSHTVPVPRGGGVSIVAAFLLAVLWLAHRGVISESLRSALVGGGLLIAALGLLDDHLGLSARLRLPIHFAAAGWALWQLDGARTLHLDWIGWDWTWGVRLLALVGLVWMINLYNFMDGTDGIAGVEAACASGLGGLLLMWSGFGGLAAAAPALAGASAGFLAWNWSPAKIFMGDVGSGFLGFVFGVLIVASAKEQSWLLWPWLILLSVFIVDSTLTLIRRFATGARWYEAHCSHAYQHAARRWNSHSKVALAVAAVNVFWLFPLAWGACIWPAAGPVLAMVALAPLVYLAFRYDAGRDTSATEVACSEPEVHDPPTRRA